MYAHAGHPAVAGGGDGHVTSVSAAGSLLGPDESRLHQELTDIENRVRYLVLGGGGGGPPSSSSSLHGGSADRQIKEHLSGLRQRIRDLELLREEQDT